MIGKKLDRYEIVDRLGSGGMGEVYEARHEQTGRRVAIKVILSELTPDESLIARFHREARAAGQIDSRHIAQVLDAGKDSETGAPYLVMELLRGYDLDTLIKERMPPPMRPSLALRIVAQALAGLEKAHAAKVVHRDIKPANLYIAESDGGQRVVKLVDFGIAKMKDDVTTSREYSLTQTASLLGSPLYMSPEQARTSKSVDGRADLWSLGVVLYQLMTGRAPHAASGSLTELLLAICTEPAEPAQDRAAWIPPEAAHLVMRSIEIEQAKRFHNATEMLAAIAEIVPDWQHLDESMMTPLTDEERAFVAPRLFPPSELGVSTGPNSQRSADLDAVAAASATVADSKASKKKEEDARAAATTTGDEQRSQLAESLPGVSAISSPGNRPSAAVVAAAAAASGSSTTRPPKSRLGPLVIGVGAVVIVGATVLGVSTRPRGPVETSTGVVPAAPPQATTTTPTATTKILMMETSAEPSAAPVLTVPSASSHTSSSTKPIAVKPPPSNSTTAPSAAASSKPATPPPPKPTTNTTSSSPISREFN